MFGSTTLSIKDYYDIKNELKYLRKFHQISIDVLSILVSVEDEDIMDELPSMRKDALRALNLVHNE